MTFSGTNEFRIKINEKIDCTICELVDTRGLTRFSPCDTNIWYYLSMDGATNKKIVEFVDDGATRLKKGEGDSIIHFEHVFISDTANIKLHEFRIQFNVDTDKTLTEGLWINEDSLIVP